MMESGLTDEELSERARKERTLIIGRYDKGREKGAIIDPWEDPEFEVYYTTDRYGFIHDSRLPYHKTKEEKLHLEIEISRSAKWEKMTKAWNKYVSTPKLKARIYKGIPQRYRGDIWCRLLDISSIKEEQKGKYEEMKRLGRKWSTDVRQIDLDVNRTYRDHMMFRQRYDVKQQELFHVLVAYSVYNQEIGYCQGMSQLAALLLMFLNEEDAFWALSQLMAGQRYAMHGFFIPGFPKLLRYQEHHDKVLQRLLPKLKKHLENNYIDSGLYTLKWFFQCYLDRLPFSLTLRVWDIFLLEGERLLIAMAYTILKLHRRELTRRGMDEILEYIQIRLEKNFGYDNDQVVHHLEKCMEDLRRNKLDYPGPPVDAELPQQPFGMFIEPTVEMESGKRREYTEKERQITETLMTRQETLFNGAHLSVDQGSRQSLDQSIDEVSSLGEVGSSRISLANTSLTSAPDLSTLSSLTLARKGADTVSVQSGQSLISTDAQSIQSVRSPCEKMNHSKGDSYSQDAEAGVPIMDMEKECETLTGDTGNEANSVFDSPPVSPLRPVCLSISQTTLRDIEQHLSEPSTPKAVEAPEIVRIFVPYSGTSGKGNSLPSVPLKSPQNGGQSILQTSPDDPNRIRIKINSEVSPRESTAPYNAKWARPIRLDSPEYEEGLM